MKLPPLLPVLALSTLLSFSVSGAEPPTAGQTQILKWKDGKTACFTLGFDDSAGSQLKNVVPELVKRKIVGTFYLVTGNSLYAHLKPQWEEAAKSPYVVVANHTFTHKGANNAEELEPELAKCNEVLYALHPERKQPYLIAFAKPGGVPWIVPNDAFEAALAKHHLLNRPPFAGPPINYKSSEETLAVVDKAIAKGDMGYLVFHGVGGDWLVTPVEWFTALLDKLEKERDQLWITDTASWKKYVTERDTAAVKIVEASKTRLRLQLTAKTDPTYDDPLTLSTTVPADWKTCQVEQGTTKTTVPVKNGSVQYSAVPNGDEIVLRP
ncbi:MAG: polysaccharide deacetylase family protein [Chthoniobacter sp.]|uniref:polysaccharide deacetylase family protein n=1 Tax=Chthoniobacter sp. TaxID=2510640 RepID=UPI0032A7268E